MADKRLYTLLKQIKDRILPLSGGGTGATTAAGAVNNLKSPLVDLIYPVGAIYTSTASTNPKTLFGGTWTQITNTFLLGAGSSYSAGSTGGAATHTLTSAQMPSHTHTFTGSAVTSTSKGAHTHDVVGGAGTNGSGSTRAGNSYAKNFSSFRTLPASHVCHSNGAHTHSATAAGTNSNTGSGNAHNNMPPYLVVYMWRRTA